MATNTTRISKSKPQKLTAFSASSLRLLDANVVTLVCERKQLPEESPRGKIEIEQSLEVIAGKRRKRNGLVAMLTLSMKGLNLSKGEESKEVSFESGIALEGFFEFLDQNFVFDEKQHMSTEIANDLITQLLPIASLKVRDMVQAMGYSNIRQTIGFNEKDYEVSAMSSEVDQEEKPKPKSRGRKRSAEIA